MSWALFANESLRKGETVQVKPRGHSMRSKVNDGDLVTLEPVAPEALVVGDIVLVRVHGRDYLHLVKAIDNGRFQIGNNRGASTAGSAQTAFTAKPSRSKRRAERIISLGGSTMKRWINLKVALICMGFGVVTFLLLGWPFMFDAPTSTQSWFIFTAYAVFVVSYVACRLYKANRLQ